MASTINLADYSELQIERLAYEPSKPNVFRTSHFHVHTGAKTSSINIIDENVLHSYFPYTFGQPLVEITSPTDSTTTTSIPNRAVRVGVVFCGRQTPGAHNVVTGIYDQLMTLNMDSKLIGFIGGTKGLFAGNAINLTSTTLHPYRNQGGMHLLGRSVDRIRSPTEQAAALETVEKFELDGLILIGGTFSNSDAGHLAEYFASRQTSSGRRTAVVGVPVTIDGNLRNEFIETTVGHDTAVKVYSQLVGNMATDANSAKKYTYFVRLMGRTTGHIAMEVAMQCQPNLAIMGM
jgi:diphosphate-dependent phosphofructokinase